MNISCRGCSPIAKIGYVYASAYIYGIYIYICLIMWLLVVPLSTHQQWWTLIFILFTEMVERILMINAIPLSNRKEVRFNILRVYCRRTIVRHYTQITITWLMDFFFRLFCLLKGNNYGKITILYINHRRVYRDFDQVQDRHYPTWRISCCRHHICASFFAGVFFSSRLSVCKMR